MRATPLLVRWHDDNAPIYSAAFETGPKGRLATAGGDNNVRLWKVESAGEDRRVSYLASLIKHTQAVNVVRWCPKGEMLASAGDDGNVLLWIPAENPSLYARVGEDAAEEKETWRVKTMCRSTGSEIYDLAWSPDGVFFITGSMDNVARIYNASNGSVVRQIAEHNHYVQGVAWDPLNEYIATQSSDRSVHIYTLKTKDGQFSLAQHNKITKMDVPSRRISSNSPAPPEFRGRALADHSLERAVGSPAPSAPGTPQSLALPMNPPMTSHSRRSSFGSTSHSMRRSVSPSPSLPLPAVMPAPSPGISGGLPMTSGKNTSLYANETFTSFFRRLTFAPDGSLLFTPAGQQKEANAPADKRQDDVANMTYIYTRAGLNKPPVAKLPGHRKPSLAVRCSPIYYNLRSAQTKTKEITIDTGNEGDLSPLPEPVMEAKAPSLSSMDPPPPIGAPSPAPSVAAAPSPRHYENDSTPVPSGPPPVFDLPYRIIYGVATQDAVYVYDTQQKQPLCVVSNLHYATFTDLSWNVDGSTLLISSSDGFCSCLTFAAGELGTQWQAPIPHTRPTPTQISTAAASPGVTTPSQTPTQTSAPSIPRPPSSQSQGPGQSPYVPAHPASPARSMSISSVTTQELFGEQSVEARAASSQTPHISSVPGIMAASPAVPSAAGLPMFTPPQTPGSSMAGTIAPPGPPASVSQSAVGATSVPVGTKREGSSLELVHQEKKRRVAPTLLSESEAASSPQTVTSNPQTKVGEGTGKQ